MDEIDGTSIGCPIDLCYIAILTRKNFPLGTVTLERITANLQCIKTGNMLKTSTLKTEV